MFALPLLYPGSTRRVGASWAAGHAWSECKFVRYLKPLWWVCLTASPAVVLFCSVSWSPSSSFFFFAACLFNAPSSLRCIHCATGSPVSSSDQSHLCFFNQKPSPSSAFSLSDIHFFSRCDSASWWWVKALQVCNDALLLLPQWMRARPRFNMLHSFDNLALLHCPFGEKYSIIESCLIQNRAPNILSRAKWPLPGKLFQSWPQKDDVTPLENICRNLSWWHTGWINNSFTLVNTWPEGDWCLPVKALAHWKITQLAYKKNKKPS